jgi:formate dehydrogenase iron-sulfur subunit
MILPLIERAREDGLAFALAPGGGTKPEELVPTRRPDAGEQYRFRFDMTKCIGCKCCVVACNEQNGNPAHVTWRSVGEVEGGFYPYTQRFYLSMGCNHCLEPSCLNGCPTEAYTKDPLTGVVELDSNACIGCQYCTWNCSYGVPQYDPDRGVVGKCDLCHHRLYDGAAPACVAACPAAAIAVEIVNIAEWRQDYAAANAPGLPAADDSLSTTRVILPSQVSPDVGRVDTNRVRLEAPHWPLVFLLVLTQLAAGAFVILWPLRFTASIPQLHFSTVAALGVAWVSLLFSTLHLGRPVHAYRALKGWRRSWLSREVLTLGLFAMMASLYAGMNHLGLSGASVLGLVTALLGFAGVTCSGLIYVVPARPAWNSARTLLEFHLTAGMLGPLFVMATGGGSARWLAVCAAAAAGAQVASQTLKLLWLARSESFELRASSLLLSGVLRYRFLARLGLAIAGGIVLPLTVHGPAGALAAFLAALAGEILGRWIFFVSVVPKNVAASFLGAGKAAA